MASRPILSPYPVFNATTGQTMTGNLTGVASLIPNVALISYAFSWTGTSPVGAISIEASNDYSLNPDGTVKNAGTWTVLTLSFGGQPVTTIPISGNSGTQFVDMQTGAYALRPIYIFTSGTGTLSGFINGKCA